jgi:hypothetical protein
MNSMKNLKKLSIFMLVMILILAPIPSTALQDNTRVISPIVISPVTPILIPLADSPDFQYTTSGGKVTITKYTGTAENLVIPSKLGGNPVAIIGEYAFIFNKTLLSVTIPEGVTALGDSAFEMSANLVSVKLPSTLKTIGTSTFEGCLALSSITLPDSLTSIGEYAFGYNKLKSINIPKNLSTIALTTFEGCKEVAAFIVDPTNLYFSGQDGVLYNKDKTTLVRYPKAKTDASYTVPSTVKVLLENSVTDNDYLTSFILPSGLTTIGNNAFVHCGMLKSLTIPSKVTSVGYYAFRFCTALTTVNFQSVTTGIGYSAFGGCTNLSSLTLPSGLKTIEMYTFEECYSLKTLSLPSTLTIIHEGAFSNCINLTGIIIPSGVKVLERSTFYNCSNLSSVSLPSGLTTISGGSFSKSGLPSITLPVSLTIMGSSAFSSCSKLMDARFYGNLPSLQYADETYIKNKWFAGSPASFKIYYQSGKSGWTSPTWNGYQTQSFNAVSQLPLVPVSRVSFKLIPELPDDTISFDYKLLVSGIPLLPINEDEYNLFRPLDLTPFPLPTIPTPVTPDPVTPDPAATEPKTPDGTTIVKLYLGQAEYLVNGVNQAMDASPIMRDNRLLLPVRYIADPLGAVTGWNALDQKVTITSEDTVIELWIGNNLAMVNGVQKMIDPNNSNVKPILVPPGRTMLPLRFIGENLDCEVDWDPILQEATLTLVH